MEMKNIKIKYILSNSQKSPCGKLLTRSTSPYFTLWKYTEELDINDNLITNYSTPIKINLWGEKLNKYKKLKSYYNKMIYFIDIDTY